MATSDSPLTGIYTRKHLGRETTLEVDASSVISVRGSLNLASGTLTLPPALSEGHMNVGSHLFTARNAASGGTISSGSSAPTVFWGSLLMPDGEPAMKLNSTIDHVWMLEYVSAVVATIKTLPISLPTDFSTADGLTIELYGETVGSASAADAIQAGTILARFGVNNASAAGATHPNFTSTPSWKGITVASGTVTTDTLTIGYTPQAHALRAIRLYYMRLRYT